MLRCPKKVIDKGPRWMNPNCLRPKARQAFAEGDGQLGQGAAYVALRARPDRRCARNVRNFLRYGMREFRWRSATKPFTSRTVAHIASHRWQHAEHSLCSLSPLDCAIAARFKSAKADLSGRSPVARTLSRPSPKSARLASKANRYGRYNGIARCPATPSANEASVK